MKVKVFIKKYNNAPLELQEFAEGAAKVTDSPDLAISATAFLLAKKMFEEELEKVIEIG